MKPIQQEEETFVPPPYISQESFENLEAMRSSNLELKRWIENVSKQAEEFLQEVVRVYNEVVMFRGRLQSMETQWENFPMAQDKMIARLKVL